MERDVRAGLRHRKNSRNFCVCVCVCVIKSRDAMYVYECCKWERDKLKTCNIIRMSVECVSVNKGGLRLIFFFRRVSQSSSFIFVSLHILSSFLLLNARRGRLVRRCAVRDGGADPVAHSGMP